MAQQRELIDADSGQRFSSLDLLVGESLSGGGGGGGGVASVTAGVGIVVTGTAADPIVGVSAAVASGAAAGATALQPAGNLTGSVAGVPAATVAAGAAAGATALQPEGNLTGSVAGVPAATVAAGAAAGATALQPGGDAAFGTVALGATPALSGAIRMSHGSGLVGRRQDNTTDLTFLAWGTPTNGTTLGVTSGQTTVQGTSVNVNGGVNWTFSSGVLSVASSVTDLTITSLVKSVASATGQTTTIAAQDCSGTTAVTAGLLRLRAGNATGASGTRNGGSIELLWGTGATANGNISVGAQGPNFQGMAGGLFVANSSAAPAANAAAGGFLYAEAGALKWRGTATTTTIAPA